MKKPSIIFYGIILGLILSVFIIPKLAMNKFIKDNMTYHKDIVISVTEKTSKDFKLDNKDTKILQFTTDKGEVLLFEKKNVKTIKNAKDDQDYIEYYRYEKDTNSSSSNSLNKGMTNVFYHSKK